MHRIKRLHLTVVVALATILNGTALTVIGLAQGIPHPNALSLPVQPLATAPTRQPDWSVALENSNLLIHQTQLLIAESGTEGQAVCLHAFDLATGKPQWKSSRPIVSLYGVENNTIYASNFGFTSLVDDPKTLMTLDAKTGHILSTIPLEDPNLSEVIGASQGAFILNSYVKKGYESDHNKISAQTAEKVLWSFETPAYSQVSDRTGIIKDGIVILPILIYGPASNRSYQLTALDATTGKVLWQWNTKAEIETKVLDDTVYASVYSDDRAGLTQGWVKAFDLKSGQERWTHKMLGPYPALANGREVFILDNSAKSSTRFVVLDKETGQSLREITLAPNEDPEGPVALQGNSIYKAALESTGSIVDVQNHSWVEAFDATTGQLQWRTPKLTHSHVNFWVAGDHLVVRRNALGREVKNEIQSYSLAPNMGD